MSRDGEVGHQENGIQEDIDQLFRGLKLEASNIRQQCQKEQKLGERSRRGTRRGRSGTQTKREETQENIKGRVPLASLSRNRIKSLFSVAENVVFGDTRNEEMKREKREGGLGHDAAPHADEAVHPVVMKLENGDMNVTFSRRCQLESEKLSNECPEHLKHVQQAFLKQAEAFNLADQCNQGLPVLNRPEIRISENTAVPNPKELLKKDKEVKDVSEVVQEDKTTEDGSHDTSTGIVISFPEPKGPPPPIVRMDITESQEAKADKEKRIQKMKELLLKLNGGVDPGAQVHPPGEDNQTTERIGAIMTQVKHKKDNTYEDAILSKPRYPQVIKVFCVETANEKQGTYYRKFAACSISAVWNTYLSTDPSRMHWYEIIREDLPCHLYFDVEFRRTDGLNQNVDGEKMVDLWIGHVNTMLERNFGLHVEDKNIFELDSSSESKFSRHIIMRIPGYAFYNNIAVGDFVAQVLSACGRDLLVDVEHKGCPDRTRGFFVDTAVYTKNRHFRLAYSCKGGKAAVLMPTGRYAMAVGRRDLPTPAEILKKTMVTVVDSNSTLLCIRPLKEYAQNNPRVTSHGGTSTRSGPLATTKFDEKDMDRINPTALPRLHELAHGAVPFIEKVASRRAGKPATARTVNLCGVDGIVAYSMIGPGGHYCANVGRDHAHNNIYFVANFRTRLLCQKCHDPDCYGYRSDWIELPPNFQWLP